MRKQFIKTSEELAANDERLVFLLGDIGVFGFQNVFRSCPDRIYNIGICEQAMTSLAAGLAKEGFIPVLHSIAPFVVERCFEQLKDDLCYQDVRACIVSVGSSYDYAALGCTHHSPGDVAMLRTLPGMKIIVPGTAAEFDRLFRSAYSTERPTYFRLSEQSNQQTCDVRFGSAHVVRRGQLATVVAVGPMLTRVIEAAEDLDVTIIYYTTLAPFDAETLQASSRSPKVVVVEPFYEGTMTHDIVSAFKGRSVELLSIGVPRTFLTNYGHLADHDVICGLTTSQIREQLAKFIHART